MRLLLISVLLGMSPWLFAQQDSQLWTALPESGHYQLSTTSLHQILDQAPPEEHRNLPGACPRLQLPGPDGERVTFKIWESPAFAPGLAANFPVLRTFIGQRTDAPSIQLRLDWTYQGLHAMVMDPAGTWFIDPVDTDANLYQVRLKPERAPGSFTCHVTGEPIDPDHPIGAHVPGQDKSLLSPIGGQLQTYRTAVAATGEFTQYHGGTVEDGLSAIVTIMHRINGVYERDLACRMMLVDSNHLVVFLDGSTDPYSGSSGDQMNTNHDVLVDSIGLDSFDIGHVFDLGGGGIASLSSVCRDSRKGRGYTSTNPPEGDLFAIDYAAHEFGHQYGANHTFNNCSGSGPQPYEPGSATTIMGYAGLCGENNVALNSDDHFHVISLEEMSDYVILGNGGSCANIIDNGNTAPAIDALPPAGLTIPISTPFELTGVASDPDPDNELTYCWEQFDTGPVSPLGEPSGNAPSFRSYSPTTSPTRVFPRMQTILGNQTTEVEVLPTYARDLTFRLTVRDNNPMGGGVEWAEFGMEVTDQAGPFRVTSQNEATQWEAGTFQVITWDVANTTAAPVNADSVMIYLSAPGGQTYPTLLAGPVANDGETTVLLPTDISGTGFRVKVKAANNVFFDLNNTNIAITAPEAAGVAFAAFESDLTVCAPATASFPLGLSALLDFNDTVSLSLGTLPDGLEASLTETSVVPPVFFNLEATNTEGVATGTYAIEVYASASDTINDTLVLTLTVISDPPAGPSLELPLEAAIEVPTTPVLQWLPVGGASSYQIQVAADAAFSDILFTEITTDTFIASPIALPDSSWLYWQVTSISDECGLGQSSAVGSFFTEVIRCKTYFSEDIPVAFNNLPFINSRIVVEDTIPIRDLRVKNIVGEYTPLADLRFVLRPPNGQFFDLLERDNCFGGGAFFFNIDPSSTNTSIPCPYNSGDTYAPEQSLNSLLGSDAQGTWRLFVYDEGNNGELTNWELELCTTASLLVSTDPAPRRVDLRVYPNPADRQLTVELPRGDSGWFALYDLQGRLVQQQLLRSTTTLSLPELPTGLYAYRWLTENGREMATGKVIIAR